MKNCKTVIFSRNRALQCHLMLSTLFNHCKDIEQESDIFVLHRNDHEHEKSYEILKSEFPTVNFVKETNFKQDLLNLVLPHKSNILWDKNEGFKPKYVLFLVDDSVICNNFSMANVIKTLEENKDAIGFSLRLGLNTKICFPYNCEQKIPVATKISKNILKYNWQTAEYDFNYCLELSSSVYPIDSIAEILEDCLYLSPNTLESIMSSCCLEDKPNLLMFEKSVAFNAPLNKVQSTHPNRSADFNPDTFRLMYEKGIRFNVKQFDGYTSRGAHDIPENFEVININEN